MKTFNLAVMSIVLLSACKHDPFPGPPGGIGMDTIQNPGDTTSPYKACNPDTVYFNKDILPIFTANCAMAGCHNASSAQEGVVLTNYENIRKRIKPYQPNAGEIIEVITTNNSGDRMPPPPNNPLPASQIAIIKKWISQGAQNLSCNECDTTNLSFSTDIQPIFEQSCVSCHSGANPSGNLRLGIYSEIKDAVLNNSVVYRAGPNGSMPPSGVKIDLCKWNKLKAWVNAGMPDN